MLGMLDSGVGGLSVWKELKRISPSSGVLYFADSARVPYGNLSKEKIFIYAKESIDHLIDLGATSIAIACHTIAASVGPLLKLSTKIPVLDIASHSLPLFENLTNITLIGTKATVNSGFYQRRLVERLAKAIACPALVPMIESGNIDLNIVKTSVETINPSTNVLFLACTHFPLIKDVIQSFFPSMILIDPAESFAKTLLSYAKESPDEFFTTGDPAHFHRSASIFCQMQKVPSPFLIKSLYSTLIS